MPIYGYTHLGNPKGWVEMSEIHLHLPVSGLRQVAQFLNECADLAEAGKKEDHSHLRDWLNWDWDDCEVIVIYDAPEEKPSENQNSG